jgi:arginine repressor
VRWVVLSLDELLAEASRQCELFSNPLRSLIAALITVKTELTWTQLKTTLEKQTGKINPNTLSFHLTELANAGYIQKTNATNQPRYRITKHKQPDIQRLLGQELLKTVKEKLT